MIRPEILEDFFLDLRGRMWGTRMALLLCAVALTTIGILFINSSTIELGAEPLISQSARNQVVKASVGLGCLLAVILLGYRALERHAYFLFGALMSVLLVLLLFKQSSSVQRWISIGFLNVQPSELMKILLIVALARYLRFRKDQRQLRGLVQPFLLTLVPMFLVVAQPDLGTSLMMPPVLLAMLFVSGARRLHLVVALVIGLSLLPTMILIHHALPRDVSTKIFKEYQVRRVKDFLRLVEDRRAKDGSQLDQSIEAIATGGVTGKGYLWGARNHLRHLPAEHTDFIFAIVAEEWGLFGAGAVLSIYLLLVMLCLSVALHSREPCGRLVAAGVGSLFAAQGIQNLGMTMGLTPITGLPLPFVSYGGSSLVTSFVALGLVLSVAHRHPLIVAPRDLDPRDRPRYVPLVDPHPAGANRLPNGPH